MKPAEDAAIRERVRSIKTSYHVIEVAPGIETPGAFDMRPDLARFHFPATLEGRSVIDVGASNGFFSFHFERLGARRVVATNLSSYREHDYPRWFVEQMERTYAPEYWETIDHQEAYGGFEVARECLGSSVVHLISRIYHLPQRTSERFDFGF